MKRGLEQAEPPRLGADDGFLHLCRSAPHLFIGSKAVLVDCVAIHFLDGKSNPVNHEKVESS